MKLKLLLITLMATLFPTFVKAATVSVSLSCPQVVNENAEIKCNVNVTSDVSVNGLAANYILKGLTYVDFVGQNGFSIYSSSQLGFAVGNINGKSGTFNIGIITLKASSAGSIQLNNLDVSDTESNSYDAGGVSNNVSIRLASTNNLLQLLSLSNGTLSPSFSQNVTSYSATIDAPSVTINAIKGENSQTISGTGNHNLNYGKNSFQIIVTSEAGTTKTYNIDITRPDHRSTNNFLKSLTCSKGNIIFDKNTLEYNISVANDVNKIDISAITEDEKAIMNINNPELVIGDNVITIDVVSENSVVKTYKINVHRMDENKKMSSNNKISKLIISGHKLNFSDSIFEYKIKIDKNEEKLLFDIKLEDEKANYTIKGNEKLKNGDIVSVIVVSESGEEKEYKFVIQKSNSSNVLLYVIIISALIVIVVLGLIYFKNRKSKNQQKKENDETNLSQENETINSANQNVNYESDSVSNNTVTSSLNQIPLNNLSQENETINPTNQNVNYESDSVSNNTATSSLNQIPLNNLSQENETINPTNQNVDYESDSVSNNTVTSSINQTSLNRLQNGIENSSDFLKTKSQENDNFR